MKYLWLVVDLLHDVEFRCIKNVVYVNTVGTEDAFAGLGRMRLAVDLAVVEVDLIGVIGLEVKLPLAHQTLKTRLVVDVAFDWANALERVHLIAAA